MMERTQECITLATQWYSKNKLAHAMRVANYAMQEAKILEYNEESIEQIFQVAILHDILEDTECPENLILKILHYPSTINALKRLTHNKEEDSYEEYIKKLCQEEPVVGDVTALAYAMIIKRADIKDHLMLEETLSDKLKQKYFPIIKYLL